MNSFSASKISDVLPFISDTKVLFFHSEMYIYLCTHARIQIHVCIYIFSLYIITEEKYSSEKVLP